MTLRPTATPSTRWTVISPAPRPAFSEARRREKRTSSSPAPDSRPVGPSQTGVLKTRLRRLMTSPRTENYHSFRLLRLSTSPLVTKTKWSQFITLVLGQYKMSLRPAKPFIEYGTPPSREKSRYRKEWTWSACPSSGFGQRRLPSTSFDSVP